MNSISHKNQQLENNVLYQRIEKSFERIRKYKKELEEKPKKRSRIKNDKKEINDDNTSSFMLSNSNQNINPLPTAITTNNHNEALSNNNHSNSTMTNTLMFPDQKIIDNNSIVNLVNSRVLNEISLNIFKWNKKRKYDDWKMLETKESKTQPSTKTKRHEPQLIQKITKCLFKIQQKNLKINP